MYSALRKRATVPPEIIRMIGRASMSMLLATGTLLAGCLGLDAQDAPGPPAMQPLRYPEDYGYLRKSDAGAREALSPWASLKYIPLNEAGDIYLTIGSEFRLRYERYEHNNWGEGPQDSDGYFWFRALPLLDLHVGENFRAFGQLISAFAYDLDTPLSPIDEDRIDVLQAFVDVRLPFGGDKGSAITLRPGRQLLSYGSGRLIDARYGPNVLQSFDTAKVFIEGGDWQLDAFYARPVDHRRGEFDNETDDRQALWSLYGTVNRRGLPGIDVYYIGYENKDALFAAITGRELRHTLGARVFGEARGWDWNFEFIYQFGQFETNHVDGDISAWAIGSDTGYTAQSIPLRPRFALQAGVISGDRNPNNPDVQTFNPLFPKGKYFGELSPIGPSNLINIDPRVTLHLCDELQLTANVAFYWRESTEDGIYPVGGMNLVRPDGGSDSRYIGTQAELLLEYQVSRHFSASTSYSVFTAGNFIRDTGPHETIHFMALEMKYRF
jgi:hypothetical protein